MPDCLIALGSNVGDCRQTLEGAVAAIGRLPDTRLVEVSRWRSSAPVGGPPRQPPFLNGAARVETDRDPHRLLESLQAIENRFGRERGARWGARTLDLDLLLYGDAVIKTASLRAPHPRMTFRPFVLEPAASVAGEWPHPELGATLRELAERLADGPKRIGLLGGANKRRLVRGMLDEMSTGLLIAEGDGDSMKAPAGLQVLVDPSAEPRRATPTLWLRESPEPDWPAELRAAVECVWPGLG